MDTRTFLKGLVLLQPKLLGFALKLTMSMDNAQDLLQETSLKILDNKSKFRNEDNFKGWSMTIMKNIFINNYRKLSTRLESATNNDTSNITLLTISETPESHLFTKEIRSEINRCSEEFRVTFKYYLTGYSYQEISEKLNIPIGTVKSRIFVMRKKLQIKLKDFV